MGLEKRKSCRIKTHFLVKFFRESVDSTIRQYQKGIIENCSPGGMFITTEHLFSRGSVFTLEFELNSEMGHRILIQARAIVRWVQSLVKHPGMGVEFILFDGIGKHEFTNWLANVSQ